MGRMTKLPLSFAILCSLSSQALADCRHLGGLYSGTCHIKGLTFDEEIKMSLSIKQTGCEEFVVGQNDKRAYDYTVTGTLEARPAYISYRKATFDSQEGILNLYRTLVGKIGIAVAVFQSHLKINADHSLSYDFEEFSVSQGKKLTVISCPMLRKK